VGDGWQAMKYFIHYRSDDGVIIGHGNSFVPKAVDGYAIAIFDEPFVTPPDPLIHKIVDHQLVEMSAEEKQRAQAPKKFEIDAAVYQSLCDTDKYILPDFPITEQQKSLWMTYRQALRDLSKGRPTVNEMVQRFPSRPDGIDPVSHWRE
jgi:Phage tail assembly chaperone protein